MSKHDYYDLLGVQRGASAAELKSAFRKKAMEWHPDRNLENKEEAEQRFKDINEAYEILNNPKTREAYDRFGHSAFEQGGPQGFGNDFSSSMSDIFDHLFGDFMSRSGGRSGHARGGERGADLRYNYEITLEEAFHGKKATLSYPTTEACSTCKGSGGKDGAKPIRCQACNGQGVVRATQGFFSIERTCHVCQGSGEIISDPCSTCRGSGQIRQEQTLSVDIPPGVDDGTRLRIGGKGDAGRRGGSRGDLYVAISLKSHSIFQRDGANLSCRVPISFVTAALGGEFEVPTANGSHVSVKVPEGTQSGKQFRLRYKGMPVLNRSTAFGDLYVQVFVETPQHLTKRQKELLREFESESSQETHPESVGFFARVKDFFDSFTRGDSTA